MPENPHRKPGNEGAQPTSAARAARAPNFLFIMADQLAPRWLDRAHTPNIDSLAARGTLFDHAYCNSPICAPSRASMCTGRYVSEIGAYDNGADFSSKFPTFMHLLSEGAGATGSQPPSDPLEQAHVTARHRPVRNYRVWLSGKMHFIGRDQHHGFERRLTTDIYPASHVWTPDWNQSPCPNPGTAVDQLRKSGLCLWNMQLDYDEEVHFRALQALRDLARRPQNGEEAAPFCLCASYTHPHDPFVITREWWDRYRHDEVAMPAVPPQPIESMHPYNQWLQIHHMIDAYPPVDADVRNARHAYLGMISYLDAKVGELLAELERLGLAGNTIVVFASDHGEMLGEHGMWFKRTFFEDSVRVPLMMAGPGITAGHRVALEVSLVDLFPTFLELAGRSQRFHLGRGIAGRSLVPFLRGGTESGRAGIVTEYLSEGVCQPMRAAVHDRLKYVCVHEEPELLFDLENDPHEAANVISDPAYADRLGHLRSLVREGWNPAEVRAEVLASQQRRRRLHRLMEETGATPWDVAPDFDPSAQFVRRKNAQETNEERRIPLPNQPQ